MSKIISALTAIAADDRYNSAARLAIDEVERLEKETAKLREFKRDIEESFRATMNESCDSDDRMHCTCVPALRREVGLMFMLFSELCDHRGGGEDPDDPDSEWPTQGCTYDLDAQMLCNYAKCPIANEARTE